MPAGDTAGFWPNMLGTAEVGGAGLAGFDWPKLNEGVVVFPATAPKTLELLPPPVDAGVFLLPKRLLPLGAAAVLLPNRPDPEVVGVFAPLLKRLLVPPVESTAPNSGLVGPKLNFCGSFDMTMLSKERGEVDLTI